MGRYSDSEFAGSHASNLVSAFTTNLIVIGSVHPLMTGNGDS